MANKIVLEGRERAFVGDGGMRARVSFASPTSIHLSPAVGEGQDWASLNHDVVASSSVEGILSRPADQDIVARAAEESVVARTSHDYVVAVAAIGRELDSVCSQARGNDDVVAGQRIDDQAVVGRLGASDVNPGMQTQHISVAAGA